jgi:hypothetical protein
MTAAALVALILLADGGAAPAGGASPVPEAPAQSGAPAAAGAPVQSGAAAPEPPPPGEGEMASAPPAPEPEPEPPPRRRRYGDRGGIELGVGLTYSSAYGIAAAASGRYYVIDRVAPGIEGTFVGGGTAVSRYGLLLAAVRVVPVRFSAFALVLTGRGGRVFMGGHADGWGVGGAAAVLLLLSPTVGLELGYEALRLYPSSFCVDLRSCIVRGPVIAFRFGF